MLSLAQRRWQNNFFMTASNLLLPSAQELEYFIEVARCLNLSRAASRLGISQPSLSVAIQKLERSLGSQLFVRLKTGVQLTSSGQNLLTRASVLLDEWKATVASVRETTTEVSGTIRLGCHPSVAAYTFGKFVPSLLKDYPQLTFHFLHDLSRHICDLVIHFKCDMGLVINPIRHPELVIQPLLTDRVRFWVSSRLSGTSLQNASRTIICDPSLAQSQFLLKALSHQQSYRVVTSGHLETICELTAAGVGMGILPSRVAGRAAKDLKPVSTIKVFFEDELCLVYRKDMNQSQARKIVIDSIKKNMSAI